MDFQFKISPQSNAQDCLSESEIDQVAMWLALIYKRAWELKRLNKEKKLEKSLPTNKLLIS